MAPAGAAAAVAVAAPAASQRVAPMIPVQRSQMMAASQMMEPWTWAHCLPRRAPQWVPAGVSRGPWAFCNGSRNSVLHCLVFLSCRSGFLTSLVPDASEPSVADIMSTGAVRRAVGHHGARESSGACTLRWGLPRRWLQEK